MTDLIWDESARCSRCGQRLLAHLHGVCPDGRRPADAAPYPEREVSAAASELRDAEEIHLLEVLRPGDGDEVNRVSELEFSVDYLFITMTNGAAFKTPRHLYPGFTAASSRELAMWQLLEDGTTVEWPSLRVRLRIPQLLPRAPRSVLKGPFAEHPITIGELMAERQDSAAAWTPRDMLIQLLREIDSGLDVGAMVVTFSVNHGDGALGHGYRNACPNNFTALGLLARASHRIQE